MIRTSHKKHRDFKQKIKITINISYKFYLQKNDVTYATAYQLNLGHNQTPQVASNMQRFAYSSSFILCENQRELVMSKVVCVVNRYKCFVGKTNLIRTFCGCKPSKQTKLTSSKFYWFLWKKKAFLLLRTFSINLIHLQQRPLLGGAISVTPSKN